MYITGERHSFFLFFTEGQVCTHGPKLTSHLVSSTIVFARGQLLFNTHHRLQLHISDLRLRHLAKSNGIKGAPTEGGRRLDVELKTLEARSPEHMLSCAVHQQMLLQAAPPASGFLSSFSSASVGHGQQSCGHDEAAEAVVSQARGEQHRDGNPAIIAHDDEHHQEAQSQLKCMQQCL